MASIASVNPPSLNITQDPMVGITQVANAIQRIRAQAQQRDIQRKLAPIQEALLRAQQQKAQFGVTHPLFGYGGDAGQQGAIQYLQGKYGIKSPQALLLKNAIQSLIDRRKGLTSTVSFRGIPMTAKQQYFTHYQNKGFPANVIASLSSADKNVIDHNDMDYKQYLAYKGAVPPEGLANEAATEAFQTQSALDKKTMTQQQLNAIANVNRTAPLVSHMRELASKMAPYMGAGGWVRKKEEGLKVSLGAQPSEAYHAMTQYMALRGALISKLKNSLGGQNTDFESKLIDSLAPDKFSSLNPELVSSIFDEIDDILREQSKTIRRNIQNNIKYDPFRNRKEREKKQNSVPSFKTKAQAMAWYHRMERERPYFARQIYDKAK